MALFGESMGGIQTLLMMTQHNSDAVLEPGVHMKAAVALDPICWLYNHVPGADFRDLVNAPIKIMVGSADDYDGGGNACRTMISELSSQDETHVSLLAFPGATHIFDSFTAPRQFDDPGANPRQGGVIARRFSAVAIPLTVRTIEDRQGASQLAMTFGFIQGGSAAGQYRTHASLP